MQSMIVSVRLHLVWNQLRLIAWNNHSSMLTMHSGALTVYKGSSEAPCLKRPYTLYSTARGPYLNSKYKICLFVISITCDYI